MATRILIVDDTLANLLALDALLEPLERPIVQARSGAEALRALLGSDDFAVILMDVAMPGLDGVETASIIRARERSRNVPIIFVTGHPSEYEYTRRAYASGAVDYIVKPFDPEILRSKVLALVRLHEQAEQLRHQAEALAVESSRRVDAEEANRTKDVFISILGHDLRSPLNAIKLSAEGLHRSAATPAAHRIPLERIARSVRRMDRLIEDVLDFARGRLGEGIQIVRRETNFVSVVEPVLEELRQGHPGREIVFEPRGPLEGQWDSERLAQVISNLVANALQHGRTGPVRVVADGTGPTFRLEVTNVGLIDPSTLPRLFEPFKRGDGAAGGLGLGLYIVREIARAHGGQVNVALDAERECTSFVMDLPR